MKYFYCIFAAVTTVATVSDLCIKPLKVSVYYESYCPDSKHFITTQLHPYFCKVKNYLILNLVPFGKSCSSNMGFICQHGAKECKGNTIHNCVLKRIQDSVAQLEYVNCAMSNYDLPGHIEKTCVQASGLSVEEVNICFISQEGYQLMLNAEKETKAMTPGPLFVPTIVFDDEYNDNDQNNAFQDFESTLCEKIISRGLTNVCSNGAIVSSIKC